MIENSVITITQERRDDRSIVTELKEAVVEMKEMLAAINSRLDQVCKEKGESTTQRNPSRKRRRAPMPDKSSIRFRDQEMNLSD